MPSQEGARKRSMSDGNQPHIIHTIHPTYYIHNENSNTRWRDKKKDCELCKKKGMISPGKANILLFFAWTKCTWMINFYSYRCDKHKSITNDIPDGMDTSLTFITRATFRWNEHEERYV